MNWIMLRVWFFASLKLYVRYCMSTCCTALPVSKGNNWKYNRNRRLLNLNPTWPFFEVICISLLSPPGNANIMELSHYHNFDGKNDRKGGYNVPQFYTGLVLVCTTQILCMVALVLLVFTLPILTSQNNRFMI